MRQMIENRREGVSMTGQCGDTAGVSDLPRDSYISEQYAERRALNTVTNLLHIHYTPLLTLIIAL